MDRLNIVGQLLLSRDLENYYRDGLLLKNAISILDSDTIRYNGQKQVVNYPTSAASKESLLTYLVANFQSRMRVADRIDRDLSRLKSTSSLKEELASLPELIALERNRVDSLYELAYSGSTKKVLTHVSNKFLIQGVHPAIARFEASEESDAKKSLGDSILINLNTLNRVHRTTLKIEQRSHFIDSLFTV